MSMLGYPKVLLNSVSVSKNQLTYIYVRNQLAFIASSSSLHLLFVFKFYGLAAKLR